jgi:hypothetical protein
MFYLIMGLVLHYQNGVPGTQNDILYSYQFPFHICIII